MDSLASRTDELSGRRQIEPIRDCSGINCLLVLMQKILDEISDTEPSIAEGLQSNSFVQIAQDDCSLDDTDLDALARDVWYRPFDQISTTKLQFSSVLSAGIMRETLWSEPMFHPWRPAVWSYSNSPSWKSTNSKDTPTLVYDCLNRFGNNQGIMMPGNFNIEAFPGMNLEAEVNKRFGVIDTQELHVVLPALPSTFFYATFNVCNVTDEARLNFDDFRTLKLQPVDPGCEMTRPVRFNLMAVVKYRSSQEATDSIRIYNVEGSHELPASTLECANPEWKFADFVNGDTFFAMYTHSWFMPETEPPFPEVLEMGSEYNEPFYSSIAQREIAMNNDLQPSSGE